MSTHYETLQQAHLYRDVFNVEPPSDVGARDMWPRKPGLMLRAVASEAVIPSVADDAAPAAATAPTTVIRELVPAQWGLVPDWVKSASDGKLRAPKLVNARSETVTTSANFRDAWLKGQRCIVPMAAFFEDDWPSGKAVPTRAFRVAGQPVGVAVFWARWNAPPGH